MRDSSYVAVNDPVSEARRYVENAKEILREKADLDPETQFYRDKKYVRMAGNTLWNGVLLILEAVFHVGDHHRNRVDFYDYKMVIANRDLKLLDLVQKGYDSMHLAMGYDGNQSKALGQDSIVLANDIIDRCATMLP